MTARVLFAVLTILAVLTVLSSTLAWGGPGWSNAPSTLHGMTAADGGVFDRDGCLDVVDEDGGIRRACFSGAMTFNTAEGRVEPVKPRERCVSLTLTMCCGDPEPPSCGPPDKDGRRVCTYTSSAAVCTDCVQEIEIPCPKDGGR